MVGQVGPSGDAAPGVNKLLRLICGVYKLIRVADYESIDPDFSGLFLRYGGSSCLASLYNPSAFLEFGTPLGDSVIALMNNKFNVVSGVGVEEPPWDSGDAFNQPFIITTDNGDSGDFTGGNAANNLRITVIYSVFNSTTGMFDAA